MGNWNRHFVRVGSDGNVQAFDTTGLEFLKTIPSEQLLSKNNTLDDGSGNMTITGIFNGIGGNSVSPGFHFNSLGSVNCTAWHGNVGFGLGSDTVFGIIMTNGGLKTVNTTGAYSNVLDDNSGNMLISGKFTGLNSIVGAMNGMPLLSGFPDLRTGVTAADASAITIFSSTVSGTRYEIKARILATAGSSATYTVSWTEGGVAQKVALTITAVDTEVHDNFVIAPDSGTNITAQITALTSSTVNVDAIVSVLG